MANASMFVGSAQIYYMSIEACDSANWAVPRFIEREIVMTFLVKKYPKHAKRHLSWATTGMVESLSNLMIVIRSSLVTGHSLAVAVIR